MSMAVQPQIVLDHNDFQRAAMDLRLICDCFVAGVQFQGVNPNHLHKEELVTICLRLKVKPDTARRAAREGRLSAWKAHGEDWMTTEYDLRIWLKKGKMVNRNEAT